MAKLLEVSDLKVSYKTYQGLVQSVRGVSFYIDEGETVALVGESGCGKSVTSKSILRLIYNNGKIDENSKIIFEGKDIMKLKERDLRKIRGRRISMIFQDALASLNPTMKIGKQIDEILRLHTGLSKKEVKAKTLDILKKVGISDEENRYNQYPFSFSGGQRQRIMIGMALACNPKLLIADEPTTALDVTVQDQILTLLDQYQQENNTSILLITHDLGVVANSAKRVYVMYAGQIVESGTADEIFYSPQHPYTWALLHAVPRMDGEKKEEIRAIEGTPPDLIEEINGCPFASRCQYCMGICSRKTPQVKAHSETHFSTCWLNDERSPRIQDKPFVEVRNDI